MSKLYIAGCSGHGKVVADIALRSEKYENIYFLEDQPDSTGYMGIPVVGVCRSDQIGADDEVIVAIGDAYIREQLLNWYEEKNIKIPTLIHPRAVIGFDVEIGRGTVIMAGTVINPAVRIGRGVILNTGASVDHDNEIGDYAHISVGAHLAGSVKIGKGTWIGAGAVVSNNIEICHGVMVGAGAVVVKDIFVPGIYIGVPARKR